MGAVKNYSNAGLNFSVDYSYKYGDLYRATLYFNDTVVGNFLTSGKTVHELVLLWDDTEGEHVLSTTAPEFSQIEDRNLPTLIQKTLESGRVHTRT